MDGEANLTLNPSLIRTPTLTATLAHIRIDAATSMGYWPLLALTKPFHIPIRDQVSAVTGLKDVQISTRLTESPAIIVGHESASMRRMMTMVEAGRAPALPPQTLEINGSHPIIRGLAAAQEPEPELAKKVATQLFSNALISAGLLDDPRTMLPNVNELLEAVLRPHAPTATASALADGAGEEDASK